MDDYIDPLVFPGWIWVVVGLVVVGLVTYVAMMTNKKSKSRRSHRSRSSGHSSSSGSSRHHKRPRREGGTFDKY